MTTIVQSQQKELNENLLSFSFSLHVKQRNSDKF